MFWSVATWVESFWLLVFSREIWQHRRLRQGRSMTKGDDEKTERTVEGAQMKIQTSAVNFYIAPRPKNLNITSFRRQFWFEIASGKEPTYREPHVEAKSVVGIRDDVKTF